MISGVKTFIRSRMKALGYVEWTDGFNFENIPSTVLDDAFHLELGPVRSAGQNQHVLTCKAPVTVRIFFGATRDPKTLIDRAEAAADSVILDLVSELNNPQGEGLKSLDFETMRVDQLDPSNDNGVIVKMDFSAVVMGATA